MSFLPLHRDKEYKFKNGHWTWEENEGKLKFHSHEVDKEVASQNLSGLEARSKFKEYINVADEKIFREIFSRPKGFIDSEIVTLQDIKNIALFTLIDKATNKFIEFVHTEMFDNFLHSVIFYSDLFVLILEFLLIRRDEQSEGRVKDTFSIKVEQFLSKQLSDRRLLVARDYSKVLNCFDISIALQFNYLDGRFQILLKCNKDGSTSNKFPTRPSAQKDLKFFESLIEFTTQCTFIGMHRRAFNAICEFLFHFCASFLGFNFLAFAQRKFFSTFHNFSSFPVTFFVVTACELNRLFRTEFFNLVRTKCCRYQFSFREQQVSQSNNVVRMNFPTFFFRFFMVTSGSRIHWRISVIKIRLWWLNCCWLHQSQKKKFSELDERNISGIYH